MSTISTHVLDTSRGRPGEGMVVRVERGATPPGQSIASGVTDRDGRVGEFASIDLEAGDYRLVFDTGGYFATTATETFFPTVEINFTISGESENYHVPLLLSPFAFSTYRGS